MKQTEYYPLQNWKIRGEGPLYLSTLYLSLTHCLSVFSGVLGKDYPKELETRSHTQMLCTALLGGLGSKGILGKGYLKKKKKMNPNSELTITK